MTELSGMGNTTPDIVPGGHERWMLGVGSLTVQTQSERWRHVAMVWHMHWDTSRRTWYSNPSGRWLPFLCGAMCFSLRHALCCLPIVPQFIGGTDCIRFSRSWNVIGFRATGEFPTSLVLGLISSELRWGAVQYVRSRTDL